VTQAILDHFEDITISKPKNVHYLALVARFPVIKDVFKRRPGWKTKIKRACVLLNHHFPKQNRSSPSSTCSSNRPILSAAPDTSVFRPLILDNPKGANHCFINASLQALYAIPEARKAIQTFNGNNPIFSELRRLFTQSKGSVDRLRQLPGFPKEMKKGQQDAHEFLLLLLNEPFDVNKPKEAFRKLRDCFVFEWTQITYCMTCTRVIIFVKIYHILSLEHLVSRNQRRTNNTARPSS